MLSCDTAICEPTVEKPERRNRSPPPVDSEATPGRLSAIFHRRAEAQSTLGNREDRGQVTGVV